jgi:hypothetical protein
MRPIVVLLATALVAWLSIPAHATENADIALLSAKIMTMNPDQPQAQAIAVRGRKILAVGSDAQIRRHIGPDTMVYDLDGKLVTPGLVEGHGHLVRLGRKTLELDLTGVASYEELVIAVKHRLKSAKPGQWILGRGWDQNLWSGKTFPQHEALSAISPDHPVYLVRVDGHAALVNQRAMTLANLTAETKDPAGGRIIRDKAKQPTGVLVDRAMELVRRHIPTMSEAALTAAIKEGVAHSLAYGITMFHDAGVSGRVIDVYRQLVKDQDLPIRLFVMLHGGDPALLKRYFAKGPQSFGNDRLIIRSVKLMADGALGSRGAALHEAYHDEAGHHGLLMLSEAELTATTKQALKAGFQVATHAIGDRTNHIVLNAYEKALGTISPKTSPRLRIEHAQILDARDIPRFGELGVIASMQPIHCTSDSPWVPERIGPQRTREGAYVWQKINQSGGMLLAGSDAPVEPVNPLLGLYAATTRQTKDGKPPKGWNPSQKLSMEEALRAFTVAGAYGAFMDDKTGSLVPGKLADLAVFDQDFTQNPAARLHSTKALLTMVDGRLVYRAANAPSAQKHQAHH